MKRNGNQKTATVVIEATRAHLLASVVRPLADGGRELHVRSVPWNKESRALTTEAAATEFAAALAAIVQQEKLAGLRTTVCLNEDFCVTLAVAGVADRVRRELSQIEERNSLYLTLGLGPKSYARSVRSLDARHHHALFTVTNERVLHAITSAVQQAGLVLETVEPALVSLARAAGHTGCDAEAPIMIVNLGERNFEVGITHRGQLLLDYRPGGRSTGDAVSDVLRQHLARLDRYCQRHFRFPSGSLKSVFLCGSDERVAAVAKKFSDDGHLHVNVLKANEIAPDWQFTGEGDGRFCSAIGAQLAAQRVVTDIIGPNFMERIRAETRAPLAPVLIRAAWPMAAALLLSIGLWGLSWFEERSLTACADERAALKAATDRAAEIQKKMLAADARIKQLTLMEQKLARPTWNTLLTSVAQCMPDDVWLENVTSQADGQLQLAGASFNEGGVYEFMRHLKESPRLRQVALEQTQPAMLATGPATRFDVNCDFAGRKGEAKERNRHD